MRYHANRVERETLEQLVADGEKLNDVQKAKLGVLQSAKNRNSEATLLRYHANRVERETLEESVADGEKLSDVQKAKPTPKERKTTQRWSAEEDEQLAELVASAPSFTRINWTELAENMTDRTAKQCRDRYTNSLKPNQKKGQWTEEEDSNIMKLQEMFGNQWSKIAARKSYVKF